MINKIIYTLSNYLHKIGILLLIKIEKIKLLKLKNKYKGERCFIIGNGPSLNKTDLSKLKNEYTFGLNRIYLNFNKMEYKTNFLVTINKLLISQCHQELDELSGMHKFTTHQNRKYFKNRRTTHFLKNTNDVIFSKDISKEIWEGATVTYVAMQIAYYLGFSKVYLIGVDHNFVTKGKPHKTVLMKSDDKNHFDPKYFKGMKWQLPDLQTSEIAYRLAKSAYEDDGRVILDATIGGKLRVYKKISYDKLFNKK